MLVLYGMLSIKGPENAVIPDLGKYPSSYQQQQRPPLLKIHTVPIKDLLLVSCRLFECSTS